MHLEPLDGEAVFVIHDLLSPRECADLIARSEGMKIVPLCSYASAWLRRNDPEMIA